MEDAEGTKGTIEYNVRVHSASTRDLEEGRHEVCSVVLEVTGEKARKPIYYIVEKDTKGRIWAGKAVQRAGGIDTGRIAKGTKTLIPPGLESLFEPPVEIGAHFDYLGKYLTDVLEDAEPKD